MLVDVRGSLVDDGEMVVIMGWLWVVLDFEIVASWQNCGFIEESSRLVRLLKNNRHYLFSHYDSLCYSRHGSYINLLNIDRYKSFKATIASNSILVQLSMLLNRMCSADIRFLKFIWIEHDTFLAQFIQRLLMRIRYDMQILLLFAHS